MVARPPVVTVHWSRLVSRQDPNLDVIRHAKVTEQEFGVKTELVGASSRSSPTGAR